MLRSLAALTGAMMLALVPLASAQADNRVEAQALVERANATLKSFLTDENFAWMRDNMHGAKGIMILPNAIKGGFILGGSGGKGVLMVRNTTSSGWSNPAFYRLGSITFGLQAGAEASEVILMVMTQNGIDRLLNTNVNLGGDVSITAGPVGAGAKAQTSDILAFSRSKGLYGGINLEGGVIKVHNRFNRAYYNTRGIEPSDILLTNRYTNQGSKDLRATLARLVPNRR